MSRTVKRTRTHWARLAVDYYRDPKMIEVGVVGEAAFVRLLALAREVVETSQRPGLVAYLLVARELREVSDLWAQTTGGTLDTLLDTLTAAGLIHRDGTAVVVTGYEGWQTTRDEIEATREEARARQQASRERRKAAQRAAGENEDASDEDTDEEGPDPRKEGDEMGVYDEKVGAFEDLRAAGEVRKGKRKVGKHGLDPALAEAAEKVVAHLTETRKAVLGGNFRVTDTWWADVRKLLTGSGDAAGFTADQLCDLIDFALNDRFWHAHCQTPNGLVRHGGKIYNSDEFVAWSKAQGRPKTSRPRDHLVRDKGAPKFKGKLAADEKVDWSKETGQW